MELNGERDKGSPNSNSLFPDEVGGFSLVSNVFVFAHGKKKLMALSTEV